MYSSNNSLVIPILVALIGFQWLTMAHLGVLSEGEVVKIEKSFFNEYEESQKNLELMTDKYQNLAESKEIVCEYEEREPYWFWTLIIGFIAGFLALFYTLMFMPEKYKKAMFGAKEEKKEKKSK